MEKGLKLYRGYATAWKGYVVAAHNEQEAALIANRAYYGKVNRLPKVEERIIKAVDMFLMEVNKPGVVAYID